MDMKRLLGVCLNRNVILGLVAVGLALFLLAPNLSLAALPLLLLAACPLSMVLMAVLMRRGMHPVMSAPPAAQDRLPEPEAPMSLPEEARVTQLRSQLQELQEQQAAIMSQLREQGGKVKRLRRARARPASGNGGSRVK